MDIIGLELFIKNEFFVILQKIGYLKFLSTRIIPKGFNVNSPVRSAGKQIVKINNNPERVK